MSKSPWYRREEPWEFDVLKKILQLSKEHPISVEQTFIWLNRWYGLRNLACPSISTIGKTASNAPYIINSPDVYPIILVTLSVKPHTVKLVRHKPDKVVKHSLIPASHLNQYNSLNDEFFYIHISYITHIPRETKRLFCCYLKSRKGFQ